MTPLPLTAFTITTALGHGLAATRAALAAGRSGLTPADPAEAGIETFVGAIPGLDDVALPAALAAFECRNHRLAELALAADGFAESVAAAAECWGRDRIGVVIGTSTSGVAEGERAFRHRDQDGALPAGYRYEHTHDFFALSRFVRRRLELAGPAFTVSTACSSSAKVFADAAQLIGAGICDAVVVGGVDTLCLLSLRGFASLELISPEPCRPNDRDRRGISIGEGAGFALLERRPRVDPKVMVLGYGESSDAYHMSSPHPEGRGAAAAMHLALTRAGLEPDAVGYVNLHGTGTVANDRAEALAVARVFGEAVPCSSTKGWTGHALGAAGIVEAAIAALCLTDGFLPENLNLRNLDPALPCRVLTASQQRRIAYVLSNSFGFGGNNCSLVLGLPA